DFLSKLSNPIISKNSWVELIHNLRKIYPPKHKSCIVATSKNEGVYLVEWIAYHLSIGFDAIFIYSNDNDDGSDELLNNLHNEGIIYYIKNIVGDGVSAQNKAYAHALTINKEVLNYEWSLFIDIDEFFVLNEFMFSSITDYLDWQNKN
uniref:glycosyltransferase family 2 protein n=1 Tax=Escherichia coli TaxID=562 RepID=UPI002FBEF9A9